MKKLLIFSLVSILLLPLLAVGCSSSTTTNTVPTTQTIEITLDQFSAENNILKTIDLAVQGTLTVKLGSNPSTGYSWTDAEINTPAIIKQISRNYVAPDTELVGAGGTEVWVFNSQTVGTATIKMSYGQPWEGGAKDTYTLTIVVHVNIYLGP
jgi:inhibitor of cysteine peptidase